MIKHCSECHHEWQTFKDPEVEDLCDWCGSLGFDMESGNKVVQKDLRPVHTCWRQKTIRKHVQAHVRRCRRLYKQYMKTGSRRILEASKKKIGRFDFD